MKPALILSHSKTSRQVERGQLINRYWFRWSGRTDLRALVLRVELLDADGGRVDSFSIKLPRTRLVSADPLRYDTSFDVSIDGPPKPPPVAFRYYTVSLLKKSEVVTGEMSGAYDDLSAYG